MDTKDGSGLRANLLSDGFCVVEKALPASLISELQAQSDNILQSVDRDHRDRNRSQGSLVQLADYPQFAPLIGAQELRDIFSAMKFGDPRFSSGYLISKPPQSPALFWHQDWWGWDDKISYTSALTQVFVMIYLTPTTLENGCLRVVPGSHRTRHPLHASLQAHDESLSRVVDPDHPLYQTHPDAVPVAVDAGDVVIGDARLLHSTYPNQTNQHRSLITLWYHPDHKSLPAPMRATIRQIYDRKTGDTDPAGPDAMTIDDWPASVFTALSDLLVPDEGIEKTHPWNRVPNWGVQP